MYNLVRVQELMDKTVDLTVAVSSGNEEKVSEIVDECRTILNAIDENA